MSTTMTTKIAGNTYEYRGQLKGVGATWNPADETWSVPAGGGWLVSKLVFKGVVKVVAVNER